MNKFLSVLLLTFCFSIVTNKIFSQDVLLQDSTYQNILKIQNDSLKRERISAYTYQLTSKNTTKGKAISSLIINDAINKSDFSLLAKIYGQVGYAYLRLGDYTSAYPIYINALAIHQKIDEPNLLIKIYQDLMWIQIQLKELDAAENSIRIALKISKDRKLKLKEAENYNLLGILYDSQSKFDEAISSYKESLNLNEKYGNKYNQLSAYINLGISYRQSNLYIEALESFKKAELLVKDLNDNYYKQAVEQNLAELTYKTKDYDAALKYILVALNNSKGNYELVSRRGLFENLKNIYAAKGEFKQAYAYADSILILNEKVFSKEKLSEIRNLQVKYETQIKDQKFENQQFLIEKQSQTLAINLAKLQLSEKQKQIQSLSFLNKQSQFINEKKSQSSLIQKTNFQSQLEKKQSDQKIEAQDLKLESSNRLMTVLAILIFSLLIITFIINENRKKTNKLTKKILEQKADIEKINTVKDQMFGIIAHDLRIPINTLLSFNVLLNDDLSIERMRRYANEIKGTLNHTSNLMTNLLNWANSQMQGYKPNLENLPVLPIVNQALNIVKEQAHSKKIVVSTNIPSNTNARIDGDMLALVLRNLLTNAIKFTQINGLIKLGVECNEKEIHLILSDNGKGLTNAQINQINAKEVSYSFSSSLGTNNEKGTGLGLLLSRTFVNLMNGTIKVKSIVGKGSTFTISLPNSMVIKA